MPALRKSERQKQRAGKSEFRTPVESSGLQKPEMPALRNSTAKSLTSEEVSYIRLKSPVKLTIR
jgi:hypothetical protein